MYRGIVFRHTWYRWCFIIVLLLCDMYALRRVNSSTNLIYTPFWFLVSLTIPALICLGYTIRYHYDLHQIKASFDAPMNEVLTSCGKVIAGRHFFYPLFLLTFEKPAKICYKDIVRINAYSGSNPKSHRKYFYIHIYTKDGKRYVLKSFHTHYIDFRWNENVDGFTNWNNSVDLLLQFSHNAKFSPHFPEHDAVRQFFKNRKHSKRR